MSRPKIEKSSDYTIQTFKNRDSVSTKEIVSFDGEPQREIYLPFIFGIRGKPSIRLRIPTSPK